MNDRPLALLSDHVPFRPEELRVREVLNEGLELFGRPDSEFACEKSLVSVILRYGICAIALSYICLDYSTMGTFPIRFNSHGREPRFQGIQVSAGGSETLS